MKSKLFKSIIQTTTDTATLKKDVSYYQEFPVDNEITDLETLAQKIEVQFGCVYLCLNRIASPVSYLLRESVIIGKRRMYKGLLSQCIEDLKDTVSCFNKGLKFHTINHVKIAITNCTETFLGCPKGND